VPLGHLCRSDKQPFANRTDGVDRRRHERTECRRQDRRDAAASRDGLHGIHRRRHLLTQSPRDGDWQKCYLPPAPHRILHPCLMMNSDTNQFKREIRFVDLCAGLGGFHHALHLAQSAHNASNESGHIRFHCVLAAELDPTLRKIYVNNFGDSLKRFYSITFPLEQTRQLVREMRQRNSGYADALDVYEQDGELARIHGDLGALLDDTREGLRCWPDTHEYVVPPHDLLCAGFPCQPFSKSGAQRGFMDDTRGTVFHTLAKIIEHRRPSLLLLENVGNFERHDDGHTWQQVRAILESLGYDLRATTQVGSKGGGLLSPHHVGFPHHRERFFIVGRHREQAGPFAADEHPFPTVPRTRTHSAAQCEALERDAADRLRAIIRASSPTASERQAATLNPDREDCLNHWNALLDQIAAYEKKRASPQRPSLLPMPSFPIWGYELDPWNHYPVEANPADFARNLATARKWRLHTLPTILADFGKAQSRHPRALDKFEDINSREATQYWLGTLPGYAIGRSEWPKWKRQYIEYNRSWALRLWVALNPRWLRKWLDDLMVMIPSHQKLEWNCQGGELDLRQHILQFRPSGLRAKRFVHVPALVAMTTTQVPVVPLQCQATDDPNAQRNRHLLPVEALQLQGFPADWKTPASRDDTFRALGNAVHAGLVARIVQKWLFLRETPLCQ
jgi:DNA (cytosine-5)-methyltransferase 1